jgi:hypothetical protein
MRVLSNIVDILVPLKEALDGHGPELDKPSTKSSPEPAHA